MDFDELSNRVIGCAIEVHRVLGPGLLDSIYEQCLVHELEFAKIAYKRQWPLPIEYKGMRLDVLYRVDLLIEEQLILELKATEGVLGVHQAQLLTYMKLACVRTGLLINFNVPLLREGLQRFVL